MQALLSQGRAPRVLVVARVQDPGKEVVGFRDLFPTRIALRLLKTSRSTRTSAGWPANPAPSGTRSPTYRPGVGYAVLDGIREPVRVRAAYVNDADLVRMVDEY